MRNKTWKILDRGNLPPNSGAIDYTCTACLNEAKLPALGLPLAQIQAGIVFDGDSALPSLIQCRHCRRVYELAKRKEVA